ncbi:MAG: dihydroneopterin aldolase [Bacteroidales bacterium]|nr:dihydroneopterin aldolase [Bacteroidales bacterium]
MAEIAIEGMEFFSYHGHFEEESVIGTRFIVDLFIETDTTNAENSDKLSETVNYLSVYQLIKHEMKSPSHLIEHVARRILDKVKQTYPQIDYARIKLRKMNPPLGGQIKSVSITLYD